MLTGILSSLFEGLINFKVVGLVDVVYGVMFSMLFFNVIFFVTQLRTKQGLQEL